MSESGVTMRASAAEAPRRVQGSWTGAAGRVAALADRLAAALDARDRELAATKAALAAAEAEAAELRAAFEAAQEAEAALRAEATGALDLAISELRRLDTERVDHA